MILEVGGGPGVVLRVRNLLRLASNVLPLGQSPVLLHEGKSTLTVIEVREVELNDKVELLDLGRDVGEDVLKVGSVRKLADGNAAERDTPQGQLSPRRYRGSAELTHTC